MRIGVMLRCIDEKQGIGVYTQNLMAHLLPRDTENEYVLFYRNPQFLGHYARYGHIREKLVVAPHKIIWDQVRIPLEARREAIDLIFHPKFTVPLFTRCKTVMVLHGSAWYVDPRSYKPLDLFYIRMMMPIYHRKANTVISVSNCAKEDMERYIGADARKFKTIYSAPNDTFLQAPDMAMKEKVRSKYSLPQRFILNVGSVSTAKNIKNLLLAYAKIYKRIPHKLVIAGRMRHSNPDELEPLNGNDLRDSVIFTGWVPQVDMPALYSLADVFVFPSWYESCSVALLEAMASGCPVVTSNTGGTPEIVGDAGILLDPTDTQGLAEAMLKVATQRELNDQLRQRGFERSKRFTWDKYVEELLALFRTIEGSSSQALLRSIADTGSV